MTKTYPGNTPLRGLEKTKRSQRLAGAKGKLRASIRWRSPFTWKTPLSVLLSRTPSHTAIKRMRGVSAAAGMAGSRLPKNRTSFHRNEETPWVIEHSGTADRTRGLVRCVLALGVDRPRARRPYPSFPDRTSSNILMLSRLGLPEPDGSLHSNSIRPVFRPETSRAATFDSDHTCQQFWELSTLILKYRNTNKTHTDVAADGSHPPLSRSCTKSKYRSRRR